MVLDSWWILLHKRRHVYHVEEFHSGKMYRILKCDVWFLTWFWFCLPKCEMIKSHILFVCIIYLAFSFKTSWKVIFLLLLFNVITSCWTLVIHEHPNNHSFGKTPSLIKRDLQNQLPGVTFLLFIPGRFLQDGQLWGLKLPCSLPPPTSELP